MVEDSHQIKAAAASVLEKDKTRIGSLTGKGMVQFFLYHFNPIVFSSLCVCGDGEFGPNRVIRALSHSHNARMPDGNLAQRITQLLY
jgi:hypothetical protein